MLTRQIDEPYVVKRHPGQKRVKSQRQSFELLGGELWDGASSQD